MFLSITLCLLNLGAVIATQCFERISLILARPSLLMGGPFFYRRFSNRRRGDPYTTSVSFADFVRAVLTFYIAPGWSMIIACTFLGGLVVGESVIAIWADAMGMAHSSGYLARPS